MGTAWALDARLAAGDVFDFTFLMSSVNGQFRQLGAQPSFRTTGGLLTSGNIRVDRFLPASVGLLIPVNLTYAATNVDPQLLTGSDIIADALPGLRKPNSNIGSIKLLVRRSARGSSPLMRILADPLALHRRLHAGARADGTVADDDGQLQRGPELQHRGDPAAEHRST